MRESELALRSKRVGLLHDAYQGAGQTRRVELGRELADELIALASFHRAAAVEFDPRAFEGGSIVMPRMLRVAELVVLLARAQDSYGLRCSEEGSASGVLGVLPVFPPDELPDLSVLDGLPAHVRVTELDSGKDLTVEAMVTLSAPKELVQNGAASEGVTARARDMF